MPFPFSSVQVCCLIVSCSIKNCCIIVAVHASASGWKDGFEKISTPEFSAARRALGIDKHWMLILENIADAAPSSDELMNALRNQAIDKSECAIVRIGA